MIQKKFLFGLIFVLLLSAEAFANPGVDFFNEKKYDAAFRALLPQAEAGSAIAAYYVGQMYSEGLGSVRKDPGKGMAFISASAAKGFGPAVQILARRYESSGEYRKSIYYYSKLNTKDSQPALEKIVELNEKAYLKEKNLSKEYCAILQSAATKGKLVDDLRYGMCLFEKKIEGADQDAAVVLLRKVVAKGEASAIEVVLPILIKSADTQKPNIDYIFVDNAIQILLTAKFPIAKVKELLSGIDLSHENCAFQAASISKALKISICRLSALAGDLKSAEFLLHVFIGDNPESDFPKDYKQAEIFMALLPDGAAKDSFGLKMMRVTNNLAGHLVQFRRLAPMLDSTTQQQNAQYVLDTTAERIRSKDAMKPTEIKPRVDVMVANGTCEQRKAFAEELDNFERLAFDRTFRRQVEDMQEELLCEPKRPAGTKGGNSQSAKGREEVSFGRRVDKYSDVVPPLSKKDGTSVTDVVDQNKESSAGVARFPNNAASSDLGTLLVRCDSAGEACALAARMILSSLGGGGIPTSEEGRRDQARGLFEKGARLGNDDARLGLFDLLSVAKFSTQNDSFRMSELLAQGSGKNSFKWDLRKARSDVMTSNPLSLIFRNSELRRACDATKLIAIRKDLDVEDKRQVTDILTSEVCK
jgi:hypothetical protein